MALVSQHRPALRGGRLFCAQLLAIGGLALCLRLLNIAFIRSALGDAQILDADFYHDEAQYWVGVLTQPLEPGPTRFANLGYSYVLAFIYKCFGPKPLAPLLFQTLCGVVSTVLIGLTTRVLFREQKAGWIAALFWALYTPAIYYDGVLLIPSLNAFLAILTLFATAYALRDGRTQRFPWFAVGAGLCVGAATLLRAVNALLLPALLGALLFSSQLSKRKKHLQLMVGALVAGFLLVLIPRSAYLALTTDHWLPVSANSGMNLWVGNNRQAEGVYFSAPFLHYSDVLEHTVVNERNAFLHEARRRQHSSQLSVADADAFWRGQALGEILADLPCWLSLEGKKFVRFWNRDEARTNVSLAFLSQVSPVLRYNPVGFWLFALLGVTGIGLLRASKHCVAYRVLVGAVIAPLVACLVFFVSGEYRFPACIPLCMAAGYAMSRIVKKLRQIGSAVLLDSALFGWPQRVTVGVLLVLVLWPVEVQSKTDDYKAYAEELVTPHPDGQNPSREDYERAEALLSQMEGSSAEQIIRQEVLLLVYSNRAIQFQDWEAANKLVETAKAIWRNAPEPGPALPLVTVKRIYNNLQRRITQLALSPYASEHPDLLRQLALLGAHEYAEVAAYLRAGRIQAATDFLTQAEVFAPKNALLMAERGRLEIAQGRVNSGLHWLEAGFNAWPKRARPALLLTEFFLRQGSGTQARMFLAEAQKREPGLPEIQLLKNQIAQISQQR